MQLHSCNIKHRQFNMGVETVILLQLRYQYLLWKAGCSALHTINSVAFTGIYFLCRLNLLSIHQKTENTLQVCVLDNLEYDIFALLFTLISRQLPHVTGNQRCLLNMAYPVRPHLSESVGRKVWELIRQSKSTKKWVSG